MDGSSSPVHDAPVRDPLAFTAAVSELLAKLPAARREHRPWISIREADQDAAQEEMKALLEWAPDRQMAARPEPDRGVHRATRYADRERLARRTKLHRPKLARLIWPSAISFYT